jgi:hypothetical protein
MLKRNQYEIIHCHSGEYQKYCRLGCDAGYCGRRINFSRELVASFHKVKQFYNLRRQRFLRYVAIIYEIIKCSVSPNRSLKVKEMSDQL